MNPITMSSIQNLAFLGVCERVHYVNQGHPVFHKHNIIGLKYTVVSHIYPINLEGFQLAFVVLQSKELPAIKVRGLLANDNELFYINIKFSIDEKKEMVLNEEQLLDQKLNMGSQKHYELNWMVPKLAPSIFVTIPIPPNVALHKPEPVTLVACIGDSEEIIGQLGFAYTPALPFTSDRIEAIRSNPNAAKWVRMLVKCNKCNDELKVYTGLEQSTDNEAEGWHWYKNLSDHFKCQCGANDINLRYIKESFHGLLGNVQRDDGQVEFHRLYEWSVLETICNDYWKTLNKEPKEEVIQKFIEQNPVVLQGFSPERIFHKAPILSKYKTDFTILDNRGHLLLIEIERPNIRLLKKDGSIASELEHAITQVNDWLHTFDQYRQACLDCIGIAVEDVVQVSGIVIAGRDDTKYGKEHLPRLKWRDFGRVTFLTYDDVGRSLGGLLRRFSQF